MESERGLSERALRGCCISRIGRGRGLGVRVTDRRRAVATFHGRTARNDSCTTIVSRGLSHTRLCTKLASIRNRKVVMALGSITLAGRVGRDNLCGGCNVIRSAGVEAFVGRLGSTKTRTVGIGNLHVITVDRIEYINPAVVMGNREITTPFRVGTVKSTGTVRDTLGVKNNTIRRTAGVCNVSMAVRGSSELAVNGCSNSARLERTGAIGRRGKSTG